MCWPHSPFSPAKRVSSPVSVISDRRGLIGDIGSTPNASGYSDADTEIKLLAASSHCCLFKTVIYAQAATISEAQKHQHDLLPRGINWICSPSSLLMAGMWWRYNCSTKRTDREKKKKKKRRYLSKCCISCLQPVLIVVIIEPLRPRPSRRPPPSDHVSKRGHISSPVTQLHPCLTSCLAHFNSSYLNTREQKSVVYSSIYRFRP